VIVDDLGERIGEVGLRLDADELGGLNQRGDDCPVCVSAWNFDRKRCLSPTFLAAA
jgi:hypothetical protein